MFQSLSVHIRKGGWRTFIATVSIWTVWYTGKWFLNFFNPDSAASRILIIYIPVGLAFYGILSERDGEGNALKAFWKDWKELSTKAHLFIIAGNIALIYFFKLFLFLWSKYFLHKPDNIKNLKDIAYGKF